MKGSSFKKLFNNVTQNEGLLYVLLVFAVFNLLAYLQHNSLAAVVLFLVTGYVNNTIHKKYDYCHSLRNNNNKYDLQSRLST